ncbi:MAG: hypothetical protein DWC03_03765 [Candidatus Poseidoniales archaeon]|nr:MAG: hypothetical protein DWC03_03765 [Candidatus Poseidoniales archaeon]|tara:strand:+ start:174 stop:485 length:312 start_codon:yes stop_codon:yes gene_type:complete
MAGKKEGAQRVLDAKASAMKVQQRLVPAAMGIVLIGIVVAYLSRWEFGLATVLMCGLLFQYALERMNTIVEASIANGLKDMGWDADTELDDQTLEKIRSIANR